MFFLNEVTMACNRISRKGAKIILGISISILIISTALLFIFPKIYDSKLKEYITLSKGSLVTTIWEDIPLPIYEKLYFFNITNSEEFLAGKEPLNVTEAGPYVFKSRWVKHDPQWNSNNTVSYREIRTYEFVPDMSVGSEDDMVWTLNGPMIIGANVIPAYLRIPFDLYCMLTGEKVIINKSVRDLAYEGYDDPIIQRAWILKPDLPYKDGKFSWLYGKNATDDGLFTVFTGTDDETKTDFINTWNGRENLTFWKGDTCNMLNGTSIETGPPIKGHQESYTFFQSIFCRSLTFNYTEDTEHYDIEAKRFRPTYSLFANSTENPDNHCFEVKKERPSGVLDISPCQFGAPAYISFPHFHLADPSYLKKVNGLSPNDELHGSHIDVEPITGLSIHLKVRFQINVEIQKLPGFHFFDDVTKGTFPVLWVDLSLEIDEDLANFMKKHVRYPKYIAYSVIGVFMLLGLIGTVVSIAILCKSKPAEEYNPLITDEYLSSKIICCGCKTNSEIVRPTKPENISSKVDLSSSGTHKGESDCAGSPPVPVIGPPNYEAVVTLSVRIVLFTLLFQLTLRFRNSPFIMN